MVGLIIYFLGSSQIVMTTHKLNLRIIYGFWMDNLTLRNFEVGGCILSFIVETIDISEAKSFLQLFCVECFVIQWIWCVYWLLIPSVGCLVMLWWCHSMSFKFEVMFLITFCGRICSISFSFYTVIFVSIFEMLVVPW